MRRLNEEILSSVPLWLTFLVGLIITTLVIQVCSKNPGEPELPPDDDCPELNCIDCPPVFIDVPVICEVVDLTIEFTVIKDQSAPNVYGIYREGILIETITIEDTSPNPVPVTFDRTFFSYRFGESIELRKESGSRAETLSQKIVGIVCAD